MATPNMSNKEMEASISLLHMMQPSERATDAKAAKGHTDTSEKGDALHKSLMEVVAKQASNELSLPRIAAHKKVHQRGARLTALSRELTLEELRPHFGRPIVEVAREFGICTTFLKKICRRCGIKRWPHRQIRSLNRTIEMLEQVESVATNPEDKEKYAAQIEELKEKQRAVMEDPDANGKLKRMKKYSTPKGASDALSTPVGQSFIQRLQPLTMSDSDAKNLSALAVAVDSVSSVSSNEAGASETTTRFGVIPGGSPLGVKIPSSALSMSSSLSTPLHASTSNQKPLALKISPSNHKLVLVKADTEERLRSSSIGSLKDQPSMEDGA